MPRHARSGRERRNMPATCTVTLDGGMLRRGFWLYVWEITTPSKDKVLYVGRAGDSSSPNAQSLFHRMGQNLETLPTSSMVRNNLEKRGVDPVDCKFRMVGRGPVFEEPVTKTMEAHKPVRNHRRVGEEACRGPQGGGV